MGEAGIGMQAGMPSRMGECASRKDLEARRRLSMHGWRLHSVAH